MGKERRLKSGFQHEREGMTIILPNIFSGISEVRAGMSTRVGNERDTEFVMNMSYNVGDDPTRVDRNRNFFLLI